MPSYSLEKWLILGLEQGKYNMSLEHIVLPESKQLLKNKNKKERKEGREGGRKGKRKKKRIEMEGCQMDRGAKLKGPKLEQVSKKINNVTLSFNLE